MKQKFAHKVFLISVFCFFGLSVFSQADKEIQRLQKQANELAGKIQNTDKKIRLAQQEVNLTESLIRNIDSEIYILEAQIKKNEKLLKQIEKKNAQLRNTAKELLIYIYKTRNTRNRAAFLMSAKDFNTAYQRFLYLKFYRNALMRQITDLQQNERAIRILIKDLENKKIEKYNLAQQKTDEMLQKTRTMEQLNRLRRDLRNNTQKVKQEIGERQAMLDRLNRAVNKEISETFERAPESSNFEAAKGKLPFPMSGIITQTFGTHRHKVLENVTVSSNGIEITGNLNAQVTAVFTGEVLRISDIPGSHKAVIIKHGNYYTVYSNLNSVHVQAGAKVRAGQSIGVCAPAANDASHSELFFQVWHNRDKLNPEQWLKKS